jgi:AcrR family transcriptional regulator
MFKIAARRSLCAMNKLSERRYDILQAARRLVLRNGLRGTTMEAIAREAHIAKPTLYAQFADKDAIYAAIVDEITDDLIAAFDEGLKSQGDVAERVGEALAGQFNALAKALDGSPHAGELMSEHKRAGAKFREKDEYASASIVAALHEAAVPQAQEMARLIMAAAYGIALKTGDDTARSSGIKLMCRHMIEGALRS